MNILKYKYVSFWSHRPRLQPYLHTLQALEDIKVSGAYGLFLEKNALVLTFTTRPYAFIAVLCIANRGSPILLNVGVGLNEIFRYLLQGHCCFRCL